MMWNRKTCRRALLILPLLFLWGCAPGTAVQGNLSVEMGDAKGIFSLAVSQQHETAAAQNADGSALEEGDSFLFSLPEEKTEFTLSLYGGTGADTGKPLFEETFSFDFSQGSAHILIEADERGTLRAVLG